MALSAKKVPTENLVALVTYAQRMGCSISEFPPIDAPNAGAHAKGSWHYDRDGIYGQAADINHPASGGTEREVITKLVRIGKTMGLGLIYALNGTVGSAGAHRTHLHADVGSYSNLGGGSYRQVGGDLVVWKTQPIVHAEGLAQDNLDGGDTRKRLDSVMLASKRHGNLFPYGVEYTQGVVGVTQDGNWGTKSRAAHDATVKALETLWRSAGLYAGTPNTIWDENTDRALAAFHRKYGV